jgi:hypothetical protein
MLRNYAVNRQTGRRLIGLTSCERECAKVSDRTNTRFGIFPPDEGLQCTVGLLVCEHSFLTSMAR